MCVYYILDIQHKGQTSVIHSCSIKEMGISKIPNSFSWAVINYLQWNLWNLDLRDPVFITVGNFPLWGQQIVTCFHLTFFLYIPAYVPWTFWEERIQFHLVLTKTNGCANKNELLSFCLNHNLSLVSLQYWLA